MDQGRREELAWAAGFYSGEGSSHVSAPRQSLRANIDSTELSTLERFHAAVGIGRLNGPYSRPLTRNKPRWQWCANGFEQAQAVACALWPWLDDAKREQFKRALLGYLQARHPSPRRAKLLARARSSYRGRFPGLLAA